MGSPGSGAKGNIVGAIESESVLSVGSQVETFVGEFVGAIVGMSFGVSVGDLVGILVAEDVTNVG